MSDDLPNRHSIRLRNFDYSTQALYFVTICTHDREYLFGEIVSNRMVLNKLGKIVNSILRSLPKRFPVVLHPFQIMPNHVHLIIQTVGAIHESPGLIYKTPNKNFPFKYFGRAHHDAPLHRSLLSKIVGYLKMNSTKLIHISESIKSPFVLHVWQLNYYDHIVRNQSEYDKICYYITHNPEMWDRDRNNLNNINFE